MSLRVMATLIASVTLLGLACGGGERGNVIRPSGRQVAEGQRIYAEKCAMCHGGSTDTRDIKSIPPPHNSRGHTWHHPDEQLVDIILNGFNANRPDGQNMPPYREMLTEQQARALVAYMKSMWTTEQVSWQATVTVQASSN